MEISGRKDAAALVGIEPAPPTPKTGPPAQKENKGGLGILLHVII